MEGRCEGWVRQGGVFTLGPVTWQQCENKGVVMLTCLNDGAEDPVTLPACLECWQRAKDDNDTKVLGAEPIVEKTKTTQTSERGDRNDGQTGG